MSSQPLIIDQQNTGNSSTQLSSNSPIWSALFVENNHPNGQAIYGRASAPNASRGIGVLGESKGYNGTGVWGSVYASSGTKVPGTQTVAIGVKGECDVADTGYGVQGVALPNSGVSYGVYGLCSSLQGAGVYAENQCTKESGGDALLCTGHAMPTADDRYNLGNSRRRWKLIRGVTITPGDLVFENGVRTTEENDGLAFFNPNGTKIALLDSQGNFHIKGKIIKDL